MCKGPDMGKSSRMCQNARDMPFEREKVAK